MTQPRFSQQSVARFKPIFDAILTSHRPIQYIFNPVTLSLSPTTFAARLRDAALAISKGTTTLPGINSEEFRQKWALYEVSIADMEVLVRPRNQKEQPESSGLSVVGNSKPDDVIAVVNLDENNSQVVVQSFATLLGYRFLEGQIRLIGEQKPWFDELTTKYDIAIVQETETQHLMF
jgi:hypothetical protein